MRETTYLTAAGDLKGGGVRVGVADGEQLRDDALHAGAVEVRHRVLVAEVQVVVPAKPSN